MKVLISASGLDFEPKLVETGNGYATVYGSEVENFETFDDALRDFRQCCSHAASCMGLLDEQG